MRRTTITDLPVEVLAMIFLSILQPLRFVDMCGFVWKAAEMPPAWYMATRISHVCRHWRFIALATPRLWTWVVSRSCRDLSMLPDALRRSGTSNVFLSVSSPNTSEMTSMARPRMLHPMQRAQWKRGLDAIVQNMYRIVHLWVFVVNWEDAQVVLDSLRPVQAPQLRSFKCVLEHPRSLMLPKDIFGCCAPNLRYVSLVEVFPEDWSSPVFRSVEYWDTLHGSASDASDIVRARHPHLYPTIADVVLLLSASNLRFLHTQLYAFGASDAPISSSCRRTMDYLALSLRSSSSEETFRQLASAVDLTSITLLILHGIPITRAVDLLNHLPGQLDVMIGSAVPDDVEDNYLDGLRTHDDAYDVGHWHIRSLDSRDYIRVFSTEKHAFTRDRGLEIACATLFCRIQRLHITAGQWSQVSATLSSVRLPCLTNLAIRYTVERAMLGDCHGPIPFDLDSVSTGEPVDVFMLRGAVLQLPALTELVVHGAAIYSTSVKYLPLTVSTSVLQNISKHLSLDDIPPLKLIHLINITPVNQAASSALSAMSTSVVHTLDNHVPEWALDWRSYGRNYWWSRLALVN